MYNKIKIDSTPIGIESSLVLTIKKVMNYLNTIENARKKI